jgi:hypothetical protein
MAGDGDLVVREHLLGELEDSAPGVVWDVRGIAGAGKSVLLRELGRRAGRRDVVIPLEMQDYYTAFERGEAAGGRPGGPGGELRRFGRVLSVMAGALLDRLACERALNDIGRAVGAPGGELSEAAADFRAEVLTGSVVQRLNERIEAAVGGGGRVLLLVDTFELVIDRPFGRWFARLIEGLNGAVVVIARRTDGLVAAELPLRAELRELEVGGLTADEVGDYLARRLGAPGGAAAAAVHEFTGGHALAVGLAADLAADLRHRGEDGAVDALIAELIAQPAADDVPDSPLGKLVGRFVQSAKEQEPAIGKGLDCLWVVRRFEFPLLKSMLAVDEATRGAYRLAERLVGYSFVEQRTPAGKPMERYYAVHDHVREVCLGMLGGPAGDPDRLQELHGAAEDYYGERTSHFLEGYEGWFRYEDPDWQALVREWLYHHSQRDRDGEPNGRRGLLKLFLDAFLWWGHYIPFAFSEELLADWAEMAAARAEQDNDDRDWGNWLREVYQRYPKGRRAAVDRVDDWEAVKTRLSAFLSHREIAKAPEGIKYLPRVRAMLHLFLGTAERSLNPSGPAAAEHFQAARALLGGDEAQWIIGWVWHLEADATLMRGAPAAAGAVAAADAGWRAMTELADDGDPHDYELAANLHRAHADAAWLRGEHALAMDLYARATLSAYKFQVAVGDPDIAPIDEYTQAFMTEMHERAAQRLSELHEAGEDSVVREACARIRRFFGPYWRAIGEQGPADPAEAARLLAGGRAERVVAGIFPPPPAAADLHQLNTRYALTATGVCYDMEEELAKPPGTAITAPVR